jgi:AraC-like DNA-binding protein
MIEPWHLSQAIAAVERKYGCWVCFHDYTGTRLLVIPETARIHQQVFCATVKSHYPPSGGDCAVCDFRLVQNRIRENPAPFFKQCHAGVLEAVVPVLVGGKLAGAMFAGPFRPPVPLPPDTFQAGKPRVFPAAERLKSQLAVLPPEEWGGLLALMGVLAAQLAVLVERQEGPLGAGKRQEQMLNFLAARMNHPVGLPDLARHLQLSVSRTSQLVRENFGCGFPHLLTRQRLEYARSLLVNSQLKITAIAALCGFRDAAYFHRVFHRQEGLSPLVYRRRHQTADDNAAGV